MDYVWIRNINWNNDAVIRSTYLISYSISTCLQKREGTWPMLSYSWPYLQNKWNAWFSLDLDVISIHAKSLFSLQILQRWEKCFYFSSSFATLVMYTENNFLLVFKCPLPIYLFHQVSQFVDLWGNLTMRFSLDTWSDSYHFVVMHELWFHNLRYVSRAHEASLALVKFRK